MAPKRSHGKPTAIGDLWAETSDGHCLFDMPVGGDFSTVDQQREGQQTASRAKPPASSARRGL
jgi:hypothetical protein